jgi:hypothetical protein
MSRSPEVNELPQSKLLYTENQVNKNEGEFFCKYTINKLNKLSIF